MIGRGCRCVLQIRTAVEYIDYIEMDESPNSIYAKQYNTL